MNSLKNIPRSTYLSLLDQCVQSADTTSVTRGHSIYFVHNQAGSRVNLQPRGIYILYARQWPFLF